MKLPLITAHAGCMNTTPNTINSILEGINAGADIIEVDVRATKDGIAILRHDDFISNCKYGTIKVEQLTYEQLKEVEDTKDIVTLEELLDFIKKYEIMLNLDIKDISAIDIMADIVKQKNMIDRVILSGCDKEKCLYMKSNHPGFRVTYNADDELFNSEDYALAIRKTCCDAIALSCCGINIEYKLCNIDLINYAHSRFLPVSIWTVDDESDMEKYLSLGVFSITTNKVSTLVSLKQR